MPIGMHTPITNWTFGQTWAAAQQAEKGRVHEKGIQAQASANRLKEMNVRIAADKDAYDQSVKDTNARLAIQQEFSKQVALGNIDGKDTVALRTLLHSQGIDEANVTGLYNGDDTLAMKALKHNIDLSGKQFTLAESGVTGEYKGKESFPARMARLSNELKNKHLGVSIGSLMGMFEGKDTLGKQIFDNNAETAEKTFGLNRSKVTGKYEGVETNPAMLARINQEIQNRGLNINQANSDERIRSNKAGEEHRENVFDYGIGRDVVNDSFRDLEFKNKVSQQNVATNFANKSYDRNVFTQNRSHEAQEDQRHENNRFRNDTFNREGEQFDKAFDAGQIENNLNRNAKTALAQFQQLEKAKSMPPMDVWN
jgi:hypothetical protein